MIFIHAHIGIYKYVHMHTRVITAKSKRKSRFLDPIKFTCDHSQSVNHSQPRITHLFHHKLF